MTKNLFPIKNDVACQYKWAWSSIYLNKGTTASCHRCKHYKFDSETINNFHNLPGKIADRTKMLNNEWPGNGCEYCKDIEAAGGMSDRTAFTNIDDTILPVELKTDTSAVNVTPTILEVYFSNLCNQACVYCRPSFSSVIEHEVKKFGPSNYNSDYSQFSGDDRENYLQYRTQFFEWMKVNGNKLVMFKMLGGEPFYQEEFEMCLDFFEENPCPNLTWDIFTNLNHNPERFKQKLERVAKLIDQKKLKSMKTVVSIDCWGKDLEYVRYGLNLETAEKNINTLLDTDGVEVNIHATITALSLPSMFELARKIGTWQMKKPIAFNWNTITSPPCFDIYHFGDAFLEDIDNFIRELKIIYLHPEQETIFGIRKRMETSSVNKTEVNNLYMFLNELDVRRGDDWKSKFPQVATIMQNIIGKNDV